MVLSPRLLLLDAHAYAYRAFHAIRSLSSPAGRPTNAIFGFVKMVGRLRGALRPSHFLAVWDGGLDAGRLAALPGYKAQRPEMPAALAEQLDELVAWLDAAGLASFCEAGVEADDWIAGVARRAAEAGLPVVIASSDKDFMQLAGPGVALINPGDKSERLWGEAEVLAKTGVRPAQVVDWLSLIGDAVDEIPGVPGVGPKTAAQWLGEFGSVEALLARVSEVRPERLRAALSAAAAKVRRNQGLIRLRDDRPKALDAPALEIRPERQEVLAGLYRRWGFRSLAAAAEGASAPGLLPGLGNGG